VQEIARQHHAEITIEDAHPGQTPPGTRVCVRFVVAASRPAEAAAAQAAL
jgi:two-component system sensor histidine kinase TctE